MKYTIQDDKIFMKYYVEVSDLKPKDKITLFEFIDKASQEQLIYLATNGRMTTQVVAEDAATAAWLMANGKASGAILGSVLMTIGKATGTTVDHLEAAIAASGDPIGAVGNMAGKAGIIGGLSAAAIAAFAAFVAYKFYKRFLSKAAKACKGKSGPEKTSCMNKFKIQGTRAQLAQLQKGLKLCAKTKNPAKCKAKVNQKMVKAKAKLGEL